MASTQNLFIDQLTASTEFAEQGTNAKEVVSAATVSINTDAYGSAHVTAAAVAVAFTTTGTQTQDMQELVIRIKDNGSARALSWDASFEDTRGAGTPALPSTTVAGLRLTLRFIYDSTTGKFGLVSIAQE